MTTVMAPQFIVPRCFGYAAPVSDDQIAYWQAEFDRQYYRGPRGARVIVRWEPGEPWQPIRRWFLDLAVDPRYVNTEPWILQALHGPNPRSKGHFCAQGYCLCLDEDGEHPNRRRWVGGATKFINGYQWRFYRQTGLYATPWWVVQGSRGGHRYMWDREELASVVSTMRGFGAQPPAAGDLPYAMVDQRVFDGVRAEHNVARAARALQKLADVKHGMALDDRDNAEAVAKALWDWTGKQAEDLWAEGGDAIPIALEMQYGRAPIGHQIDFKAQERFEERSLTRPVT